MLPGWTVVVASGAVVISIEVVGCIGGVVVSPSPIVVTGDGIGG